MIDAQLYVAAKAVNKVTLALVNGAYQATFALTDDLGNPITPQVQTSTLGQIQGAITNSQNVVNQLQNSVKNINTTIADQQILLADAQATSSPAGP